LPSNRREDWKMRHTSLMLFIGVAAAGISVSPACATVRSSPIRVVRLSTIWSDSRPRVSAANLSSQLQNWDGAVNYWVLRADF
jgi:hypothetical protein